MFENKIVFFYTAKSKKYTDERTVKYSVEESIAIIDKSEFQICRKLSLRTIYTNVMSTNVLKSLFTYMIIRKMYLDFKYVSLTMSIRQLEATAAISGKDYYVNIILVKLLH